MSECISHPNHNGEGECLYCRISELEAAVDRWALAWKQENAQVAALTGTIRKASDIAETGNCSWVVEVLDAALIQERE